MDVSLEKYTRQGRANTCIPKKTYQITSYEELDEPWDNERSQQSSQFEGEADPRSQDSSYNESRQYQSFNNIRDSNQYHETDDNDMRDNTIFPRIIYYHDINYSYHEIIVEISTRNIGDDDSLPTFLETIEGINIAPLN